MKRLFNFKATASEMTGKNFDKWLKDAGIIDQKNITTTMTGIAFSKVAGLVRFDKTCDKYLGFT